MSERSDGGEHNVAAPPARWRGGTPEAVQGAMVPEPGGQAVAAIVLLDFTLLLGEKTIGAM